MPKVETKFSVEPEKLKQNSKNEPVMTISLENTENGTFWCECDIAVKLPLSLAPDKELQLARTRMGILNPKGRLEKKIKLYTRPNNYPDNYKLTITTYVYDNEGVISERLEQEGGIECV